MALTNCYLTLDELKSHMSISGDDGQDDERLELVITACCRSIDEWCGQPFYDAGSVSARSLRARDPYALWVPTFSTTTGLIVATDEGNNGTYNQTWTIATDYVVSPAGGVDFTGTTSGFTRLDAVGSRSFPTYGRRPRVQVTARWGFAAVPAAVQEAATLKAARVAQRADSPSGEMGGFNLPVVRVSLKEDPDVVALLSQWCRVDARPVVL